MKCAVITGAGRGLGRHIALRLADEGFAVVVTDIDEDAAAETARQIQDRGRRALARHQDVRNSASHRDIARAAAELGQLAVWVNNAGVLQTGTAWDMDEAEICRHVDVNLLGVMWGSRAAVDAMADTGGHIINIASLSSLIPAPGLAAYAATKHAVLGWSTSLRGDLLHAGLDIAVSAVCPDVIDTDMVRRVADDPHAGLLFSAAQPLSPAAIADLVADLVRRPRLVVIHPPLRAALVHALRPFPALGLRLLDQFRRLGERNRRR